MSRKDELVYVALGGAGEIGMNLYLYGLGSGADQRWIMVDCGVAFADMSTAPGVELILPDIDFIAAQRKKLLGIFITHAHEDHVGAVGRYWRRLRAPVYCTAFTAEIARRKLEEVGLGEGHLKVVPPRRRVTLEDFDCAFFPITHSIPEAMALDIKTPLGRVFHTGDFKLDAEPSLGAPTDEAGLAAIGEEGVLCLACDSTNVFEPGSAGSESTVRADLAKIMQETDGAIAATTFASNVARLKTIAEVARENERSVVVAGRAMKRMIEAAVNARVVTDFPELLSEERAAETPARHLLYLVTGSQGEQRAALARIAGGQHPTVSLEAGDLVIFSSRTVPGNEREVYRIYNRLSERGVRVIDADHAHVHVSGHAYRDEMAKIYSLLKPRIALPIHGEHRHLAEHARMAPSWGAETAILAPNGSVVRLAGGEGGAASPAIAEEVEAGRVYIDGDVHVGALDGVIRSRLKLARQGHVALALVVDDEGELIADPEVRTVGLPEDGEDWPEPLDEMIAEAIDEAIERLTDRDRMSDTQIQDAASAACRRTCEKYWGKKPEVSAIVIRLEEED